MTGTWHGTLATPPGAPVSAMAQFQQKGTTVTGWIGPSEQNQFTLAEGTLKENKLTAIVTTRDGQQVTLELTVNGDKIIGTATWSETQKADIQLTRSAAK